VALTNPVEQPLIRSWQSVTWSRQPRRQVVVSGQPSVPIGLAGWVLQSRWRWESYLLLPNPGRPAVHCTTAPNIQLRHNSSLLESQREPKFATPAADKCCTDWGLGLVLRGVWRLGAVVVVVKTRRTLEAREHETDYVFVDGLFAICAGAAMTVLFCFLIL
jgi:hypothetical protein